MLPIGQERHAKGLLHHHLGIVLPLHSARLRHHEHKGLFRLDQSWTVSLLEALSAKESSHSCTVCAHVSQCGVTQSRRLYAGRLESKLCARWQLGLAGWWLCTRWQLGRLVAATCRCSRPPSTASLRLLWSPGTDPSTHVYTLRVPKHRRSPLLASRMQSIDPVQRFDLDPACFEPQPWIGGIPLRKQPVTGRTGRLGRAC